MEEKAWFRSGDFEIEGLYESGRTARGVVITTRTRAVAATCTPPSWMRYTGSIGRKVSPPLGIIDGSDHFYGRHSRQLEEVLGRHI